MLGLREGGPGSSTLSASAAVSAVTRGRGAGAGGAGRGRQGEGAVGAPPNAPLWHLLAKDTEPGLRSRHIENPARRTQRGRLMTQSHLVPPANWQGGLGEPGPRGLTAVPLLHGPNCQNNFPQAARHPTRCRWAILSGGSARLHQPTQAHTQLSLLPCQG